MTMADHGTGAPADAISEVVAVCLAILPLASALAAALGVLLALRRWLVFYVPRLVELRFSPATGPPRRARTGPRLLSVMRC